MLRKTFLQKETVVKKKSLKGYKKANLLKKNGKYILNIFKVKRKRKFFWKTRTPYKTLDYIYYRN
jgi:hypothetical protein